MKQPIPATAIARHLYCARALAYDERYPQRQPIWRPIAFVMIGVLMVLAILLVGMQFGVTLAIGSLIATLFLLLVGYVIWWRQTALLEVYPKAIAKRNRRSMEAFGEIVGAPEFLLKDQDMLIPVVVKNNPAPEQAHYAHIMQVVAYCLMVAESTSNRPTYGMIRYGDGRVFEIEFNEDAVEELVAIVEEILYLSQEQRLPQRSHDEPRRCYACSHRKRCEDAIQNANG